MEIPNQITVSNGNGFEATGTLNTDKRRSTSLVYLFEGRRGSARVSKTLFADPKKPRTAMTPEERKAARAAAPKLTLAEKIAKREASLQALKAKAAKEAQPSL